MGAGRAQCTVKVLFAAADKCKCMDIVGVRNTVDDVVCDCYDQQSQIWCIIVVDEPKTRLCTHIWTSMKLKAEGCGRVICLLGLRGVVCLY